MTLYRWDSPNPDACASCAALKDQVHSMEAFEAAGFTPKSHSLICGDGCHCGLVATDQPEQGDLSAVPTRAANTHQPAPGEQRIKFAANGQVNGAGEFEIVAITAGVANGWTFPAAVLQESVPLWEGAACFIDHVGWLDNGHSLRDLGGVYYNGKWRESTKGVHLTLRPSGPAALFVKTLGSEMLADAPAKPRVGFSADISFTATGTEVKQIVRVWSLDLVFDPARGGAFVRALNSLGAKRPQETPMSQTPAGAGVTAPDPTLTEAQAKLQQHSQAIETMNANAAALQAQAAAELKALEKQRLMSGEHNLTIALSASKLPEPMRDHVRAQFTGRLYEPDELTKAIKDSQELLSKLTGAGAVAGPNRVHAMFNSDDQVQAAFDDLLGAPRDKALAGAKVHRLQGIREAYHLLTGDYEFHGGYHGDRAMFATTTDFAGLVKNAMNKIVVNQWEMLGKAGYNWWERVATIEHFETLNQITGTLIGTVGSLPSIAERGEYTELVVGDSPETASFTKYGGYIPLTLELIDRDETRKLKQYPIELANAGIRKLSSLIAALFTANSAVGPTLADGGALFNSTAVTTSGGHANLLTTALSATQWDVVGAAVYAQPQHVKLASGYYGTGPALAVNPKFLLVPRALQLTAMKILYPTLENAANIYSENQQRGQPGDVITVPEWTDATDFAAVCDPTIAPAIYVGERFGLLPEVFIAGDQFSPAVFMNDEHRIKVRHFLAVWVNDFRPLHKSNVAG